MDVKITINISTRAFDPWATGDDNGASVHSAGNEYLAIDGDGNYT